MLEQNVKIINNTGIHARPADMLVKLCMKYKSKIEVIKEEKVANAKSILNILALGLSKGVEVTIRIDGEDEEEAMTATVDFIQNLEE